MIPVALPRVLMVSAQFLPDMGGVETHVYETARRLAASGEFAITVLATDRSRSKPATDIIDGLPVLRVPSWPRDRDWYIAPALSGVVARPQQWDLVHCQGIHTPVPVLAMRAALRARLPYVVTFHTGGHTLPHRNALRSVQWRLIGPLLGRADSLIAVSRFEAGKLAAEAHLGDKPISVIRNGGTLPVPPPGIQVVPGRIVSPGRLERYKGHHRVIEALPHVMREVPEAHVVILGRGSYEAELRSLTARLGVSDRVTIGHVEPADRQGMAVALAEASVVAAFSDYEAHPVAVMEALGIGRPVVGYATAGIGELVEEGLVHGVKPGASAPDAAADLVRAMTQQDARALPEMPTWDTTAQELAAVYRQVLRTRQPVSVRGAAS
jgi:glycosyltransferase involved in cell wall biosynthesis